MRARTGLSLLLTMASTAACSGANGTGPLDASDARASSDVATAQDAGVDTVQPALDSSALDSSALDAAPDAPVDPACLATARDATFTANVRITADNECEVFVNGTSVGTTTSWPSPVTLDVSLFLHPSRANVIAVRATNTSSQGGNDRGIIGDLGVVGDGGRTTILVTDASWRVAATEQTGWTELGFDDRAWIAATEIAAHGDGPWGGLLGTTTAKWIWSAAVPASTSDKPDREIAYARRVFYVGLDGHTLQGTPACP